jgi:hypothetical protein
MPLPVLSVARFASPVAILAAVVVLWMRFNASPPKRGLYPLDLINYFYPLGQEVAHRLSSGELPLWNPYICGGVPLLASPQVAVFYPGTWLSLLLPTHLAIPARMFAECVLGGCFIALLLRTWELGAFAATCGATIFVFACLLGQTFWPPEVSAIIWLPWLLTCVEKLVVQWRWRWWCGFVVGTSLQLLAGFPQFVVYTFYLLGPYAMVRSAEVALRSRRPGATALRIFGLLVGVGLAAGIASVQLLPTIELMQQSQRASPLSQREVHYAHRVTPRGVAVLQRVLDPSPKLMTFDLGQGSGYVGIPTLIMLSVGIVAGYRRPLLWLLLLVGVVAFLLSDGYRGWGGHLYGLYAALPTGALFRTPERFRLLTLFGAIAVASMGFDRFDRGIHSRRQPAIALPVVVAVSTAVVITLLGPPAAAWRAVVTAALFFLAVVWGRWRSVRLTCQAGMFLLLLGDLAHATGPFGSLRAFPSAWAERLSLSGHTVMDDQSFAELSRELGLDRVAFHGLQPAIGAGPIGKVQRVDCREVLIPRSWARLRGGSGIDRYSRSLYDVASVREVFHADVSSSPELAAKTLLGGDVVYREHAEPLPGPPPGITLQRVTNHDALPRAYLADRFAVMSAEEALEHVNAGDVNFHGLVLLDREPEVTVAARSDGRFVPATITSYAPERVEIAVDAPAPAILVLTDSFYPGWHVRVNGASRQIIRANGHFRAVAVPAGRHDVVFEYRPASLRLGAAVSVLSLLILGLSSLLHARSRWLAST